MLDREEEKRLLAALDEDRFQDYTSWRRDFCGTQRSRRGVKTMAIKEKNMKGEKAEKKAKKERTGPVKQRAPWQVRQTKKLGLFVKFANRLSNQLKRSGMTDAGEVLSEILVRLNEVAPVIAGLTTDWRPKAAPIGESKFGPGDQIVIRPEHRKGFLFENVDDVNGPFVVVGVVGHKLKIKSASGEYTMIGGNQIIDPSAPPKEKKVKTVEAVAA